MESLCPAWSLPVTSYSRATGQLSFESPSRILPRLKSPSNRTGLPWDLEARASRQTVPPEEP